MADPGKLDGLWAKLINSSDPTRDAKLLGFVLGVLASIVWLSITLRPGMSNGWLTAYGIFMGSVSLGGAVWTAVDKIKGSTPPPPDAGSQP